MWKLSKNKTYDAGIAREWGWMQMGTSASSSMVMLNHSAPVWSDFRRSPVALLITCEVQWRSHISLYCTTIVNLLGRKEKTVPSLKWPLRGWRRFEGCELLWSRLFLSTRPLVTGLPSSCKGVSISQDMLVAVSYTNFHLIFRYNLRERICYHDLISVFHLSCWRN